MKYPLAFFALVTPLAALADSGAHAHPHGIAFGWIVAALAGFGGGVLAPVLLRARRK